MTELIKRRLYSLYPEQIQKLDELTKRYQTSASAFLRKLIDDAYAEDEYRPPELTEDKDGIWYYGGKNG